MYFSDVYSDRRIHTKLQKDQVLWGECLSGALYWNDFLRFAKLAGFTDPRSVESQPVTIENKELEEKVGEISFFSVTYRMFKISDLETACEDYGQAVCYDGTITESPNGFQLDDHHYFPKGKVIEVCGNTYKMLHDTRLQKAFSFFGDFSTHYGIFEGCGTQMPFAENQNNTSSISCC